jgi:hypothetical protein
LVNQKPNVSDFFGKGTTGGKEKRRGRLTKLRLSNNLISKYINIVGQVAVQDAIVVAKHCQQFAHSIATFVITVADDGRVKFVHLLGNLRFIHISKFLQAAALRAVLPAVFNTTNAPDQNKFLRL